MARDGLVSFDDLLVGRLATCTLCGVRPPLADLYGEQVCLDALQRWVAVALCRLFVPNPRESKIAVTLSG